jgi:cytoskeletal protein CcmA (bactofilin family)
MNKIKLFIIGIVSVGLVTIGVSSLTNAHSFQASDNVRVGSNEIVDGMLFAAGDRIDIDGVVEGDVYCAGKSSVFINGEVNGDVICASQSITINGLVSGDVRLASADVTINGEITGSASIGSQSLVVGRDGSIGRDLVGGSQTVSIQGTIGRDMLIGSESTSISGTVERNISGGVDKLTIESTGVVGGNIDYTSDNDATVNSGGVVLGTITTSRPTHSNEAGSSVAWILYMLASVIVISAIVAIAFPKVLADATKYARANPGSVVVAGLLTVFVAPIALIAVASTVVGIPIALITLLAWLVVLALSLSFAGYALGQAVLSKTTKQPILLAVAGSLILAVAYIIPFIGIVAAIAVSVYGSGMIIMQSRSLLRRK